MGFRVQRFGRGGGHKKKKKKKKEEEERRSTEEQEKKVLAKVEFHRFWPKWKFTHFGQSRNWPKWILAKVGLAKEGHSRQIHHIRLD